MGRNQILRGYLSSRIARKNSMATEKICAQISDLRFRITTAFRPDGLGLFLPHHVCSFLKSSRPRQGIWNVEVTFYAIIGTLAPQSVAERWLGTTEPCLVFCILHYFDRSFVTIKPISCCIAKPGFDCCMVNLLTCRTIIIACRISAVPKKYRSVWLRSWQHGYWHEAYAAQGCASAALSRSC